MLIILFFVIYFIIRSFLFRPVYYEKMFSELKMTDAFNPESSGKRDKFYSYLFFKYQCPTTMKNGEVTLLCRRKLLRDKTVRYGTVCTSPGRLHSKHWENKKKISFWQFNTVSHCKRNTPTQKNIKPHLHKLSVAPSLPKKRHSLFRWENAY